MSAAPDRRRRTARPATIALALALGGCLGPRRAAPLPAAGAQDDDGAGQLAQASVQIQLGDGARDLDLERDRRRGGFRRAPRWSEWSGGAAYGGLDPSLGGSVYGLDASAGGLGYGVTFGLGHGSGGFGVRGPAMPELTSGGEAGIVGVVTWRADRGVEWPAGCAGARVARAGGAAAGAVVFLASAPRRAERYDDEQWLAVRGAIDADGCALWPAAQAIGPTPAMIDLENGSGEPLRLALGGPQRSVVLEPGARTRMQLDQAEVVRIDADRRAPAWLLGQAHDYHTVTDPLGRFALAEVPAGTYELVVWYPPVARSVEGDRPAWTEPTVLRRRVTVGATGTVRLSLALDPAP